jgi:hypothetical protein
VTYISIGDRRFRIVCEERGGQWLARAQRDDNGDPFGLECAGASEADAIARLKGWLEWQAEHTAALEALQLAEHAYHRTIAGSAFLSSTEGPSATEVQKEALDVVESARVRLDEIRGRRPHT